MTTINKILNKIRLTNYNLHNADTSIIFEIIYDEKTTHFKRFLINLMRDIKSELLIRDLAIKQLEKEKQELIQKLEKQ